MKRSCAMLLFVFLTGCLLAASPVAGAANPAAGDKPAAAQEIRDIKILPSPLPSSAGFMLALAVVFLAAGVMACTRLRKKESREPVRAPWEAASQAFSALQDRDLSDRDRIIDYYTDLSGILKDYAGRQFDIRAAGMTTEEFFAALREAAVISPGPLASLGRFLVRSDLVKFAGFEPAPEENRESYRTVKAVIEEMQGKP